MKLHQIRESRSVKTHRTLGGEIDAPKGDRSRDKKGDYTEGS